MNDNTVTTKPVARAGIFLGIGLGGFFDGIVLHQLLQVHSMLSAKFPKTTVANLEINMFWDGLFHAFTWAMTLAGVIMLWRAGQRPSVAWATRTFAGAMLMGWGIFNFAEGIVDHYILNVHHVVQAMGRSVYDALFVLSGVVLILGGWLLMRQEKGRAFVVPHPQPAKA
jgi:uncharacterized membrane protein